LQVDWIVARMFPRARNCTTRRAGPGRPRAVSTPRAKLTGSLNTARGAHTATLLPNGMVLVAGGLDSSSNVSASAELYDPASGTWTATGSLNTGRAQHTATLLPNGMVLVAAGFDISFLGSASAELYESCTLTPTQVVSRKIHGSAGPFDINLPLTGNVGVECRSGGATNDYQMIFIFANSVTVGGASVTSGTGSLSSFSVSGSQVTVNLTGVTNVQRITVTLFNVNDGTHTGDVPVSMGVLVGDVNGNAVVNASDVSLTKSQVGQPVSGSNFREDVNADGVINSTDVALVKAEVGTALPP
jgi:hypothetical protein